MGPEDGTQGSRELPVGGIYGRGLGTDEISPARAQFGALLEDRGPKTAPDAVAGHRAAHVASDCERDARRLGRGTEHDGAHVEHS